MAKKDELFILIKSLSRSEKRYFKLLAHRQTDVNYLMLFDAIDQQEVYDESVIRKKFEGAIFLKQLHVAKHYLREQVLTALRGFHNSISKDAELKQLLRNIEILFHKELYQLCQSELQKAQRLVDKYELLYGQGEVLNWKRKLEQSIQPHNYPYFLELAKQQKIVIDSLANTNRYWQEIVLVTWGMFGGGNELDKHKVDSQLNEPATLDEKVIAYNLKYIKLLSAKKQTEAQEELYRLIDLLEQYPHRLKEDPSAYVSTINNLASYLIYQKKEEKVYSLLEKAKKVYSGLSLKTENKSLLRQIMRTYSLELELYRDSKGSYDKIPDFVINTEQFLEENKNKLPKSYLLSLWFQLAYIRFINNDFNTAQKWLNNILNTKFGDTRVDLQLQARMLNLMVHFEQENFFVLRHFVGATRRFVKKMRDVEEFERVLLRFFSKLSIAPKYEYNEMFRALYMQLFPDNDCAMIPNDILDYIDYKTWIEDKIK